LSPIPVGGRNYTFILKPPRRWCGIGKFVDLNIIIKSLSGRNGGFFPLTILVLFIMTFFYIKRREYKFLAEKKILEEKVVERTL